MSQSDYIKQLKTINELQFQNKFKPVLNSEDYTIYKEYSNVNNIINTSQKYGELQLPTTQEYFECKTSQNLNCSLFNVCSNTDIRPNRIKLLNIYSSTFPVKKYSKHPTTSNKNCFACCYDSTITKTNKNNNNYNKWNVGCSNKRLVSILCNCKLKI
jgi:hypothetical protein